MPVGITAFEKAKKDKLFYVCTCLVIASLLLVFSGCSQSRPKWIKSAKHPKYSQDEYLVGIGSASRTRSPQKDIKRAEAQARLDLAKQMQVTVSGKTQIEKFRKRGDLVNNLYKQKINLNLTEKTEVNLINSQIVERYFNEDTQQYYAMAVLDKTSALSRLKHKYKKNTAKACELLKKGKADLQSENASSGLLNVLKSMHAYTNSIKQYKIAYALDSRLRFKLDCKNPYMYWKSILQDLDLSILGGNNQLGTISSSLPQPLRVKFSYNKEPIKNFPLQVDMNASRGEVSADVKTNLYGKESICIHDLNRTGNYYNFISVRPDWMSFITPAVDKSKNLKQILKGPSVKFTYRLRTPEHTKVMVLTRVQDDQGHSGLSEQILLPRSISILKNTDFVVVNSSANPGKANFCNRDCLNYLISNYKDIADIVILQCGDISYAGPRGPGFLYKSHLRTTVYDLFRETVLFAQEAEEIAGAESKRIAAQRALRQVINKQLPNVVSKVKNKLR